MKETLAITCLDKVVQSFERKWENFEVKKRGEQLKL